MTSYKDLEIGLRRLDGHSATAGIRFSPPGSDGDVRLAGDVPLSFDLAELDEIQYDPTECGALLSGSLLADGVGDAFAKARQETGEECRTYLQEKTDCTPAPGRTGGGGG